MENLVIVYILKITEWIRISIFSFLLKDGKLFILILCNVDDGIACDQQVKLKGFGYHTRTLFYVFLLYVQIQGMTHIE